MKALKTLGQTAIIAISFFFAACSSDSNGGSNSGPGTGSFINAKVDGSDFKTIIYNGAGTAVCTRVGSGSDIIYSIAASASSTNSMDIELYGITAPGTYTIDTNDDSSLLDYLETATQKSYGTSTCSGASGTVKVTELSDTQIVGTFSFTGKNDEDCSDSKTITNGSFRGVFAN